MAGRPGNMRYVNLGPEEEHVYESYEDLQPAGQSTPPPAPRPLANPPAQVADKPPEKKTLAFVVTTFILVGVITALFVRSENQIQHLQQEISLQKTKTADITARLQNGTVSLLQKKLLESDIIITNLQNDRALSRKLVSDMKDTIAKLTEFSGRLRLSSGNSSNEGRVEVQIMGLWGTICDRKWGREESEVVCRELGKPSPTAWDTYKYSARLFGAGTGPIWMNYVECKGKESKLTDCSFTFTRSCRHSEDVGVKCGP